MICERIGILKAGKTIECMNMNEMYLKAEMYCDYQNKCRIYLDEYKPIGDKK